MLLQSFLLYILSFFAIWYGAGRIITAIDILAARIHTSRFLISFFLLGILTSIPEIAVGLTSVIEQRPEVFVGNLLGGIPVIFLFVTPILAIFGNGVKIDHGFQDWKLILSLGVILSPSIFVLDGSVSNGEACIMIALYTSLVYFLKIQSPQERTVPKKSVKKIPVSKLIIQVFVGIIFVFLSSHIIVDKTLQVAKIFHVSPFYISLIGVSLGTNLPELSLAIRAILKKKKDIAFGDYMGSAAANTVLFGIFSLLINGNSYHVQNYGVEFVILLLGLISFYLFTQSKKDISKKEGLVLLGMFVVFCIIGYRMAL